MIVSTTPVQVPVGDRDLPLIQNLGSDVVYVGNVPETLLTTGVKLSIGDALEMAATLVEAGGPLWVRAETGTSDIRILTVG